MSLLLLFGGGTSVQVNATGVEGASALGDASISISVVVAPPGVASGGNVSGVAGAGAIGDVSVAIAAPVDVTSVAASATAGTVSVTTVNVTTVNLTGVAGAGTLGDESVSISVVVAPPGVSSGGNVVGVAGQGQIGTVFAGQPLSVVVNVTGVQAGNKPITGVSGGGAVGSVSVVDSHVDIVVFVNGVQAGSRKDVVVPLTGVWAGPFQPTSSVALTGISGTAFLGDIGVATGADETGDLVVHTLTLVDPADAEAGVSQNVTGVAAAGQVGSVAFRSGVAVVPSGVAAAGAVGSVTLPVFVRGVSAAAGLGTAVAIIPPGDAAAAPIGSPAAGDVGSVSVFVGQSIAVSGVSATGAVGSVTVVNPDVVVALGGVAAVGRIGDVAFGPEVAGGTDGEEKPKQGGGRDDERERKRKPNALRVPDIAILPNGQMMLIEPDPVSIEDGIDKETAAATAAQKAIDKASARTPSEKARRNQQILAILAAAAEMMLEED